MCSEDCGILVGIFSIFSFSIFTENVNFKFLFKSFQQSFLVFLHTLSNSFRLFKFKTLGLKFVGQNIT